MKKSLVVFSGAGMSAESGLKTFRDNGGLWEQYNVYEVATPEAWKKQPELVLRFYNERRAQLKKAKFNKAHQLVAELETKFNVDVITQNIDNLHELAGSSKVTHLHGELLKARCEKNKNDIYTLKKANIELGDKSSNGHQLRPHIVWFGEDVPMMEEAMRITSRADIFVVIGTSLNVYPAANLIHFLKDECEKFLIDPLANGINIDDSWTIIQSTATDGMEKLFSVLNKKSES